jgi:hypothetical protein
MDDTTNWASQRIEVIKSAITALEERYRSLRASLEKHLAEPTK